MASCFRRRNSYFKTGVEITLKSEALFAAAKKLIPGGVNSPVRAFQPYPFFTKKGIGAHIFDVDGNGYIDYCMAYGALLLGHAHPKIVDTVKLQLDNGSLYGTPTEQEVDLAELICRCVPSAEMVRLATTGSEATMSAIRAARGYTRKKKIIKFEGCYHGAHDSVLIKAGSGAATFGVPDSLGIPEETAKNTVVVPYNDSDGFTEAMRKNREDVAAVIVEPVVANMGLVLPKEGFLETLREITQDHGAVLIFDEVVTGFRMSLGGAQEYYGVKPDLTTLGKILGGGFPMAAFAGNEDVMKMIAPAGKVYQAGTFNGNPVSVAAALATLQVLREKGIDLYSKIEAKAQAIVKSLVSAAAELDVPMQSAQVASMFQVFFTKDKIYDYCTVKTSDAAKFMKYHAKLLQRGVFIPPSQFETCFLSTSHSESDLEETVAATKASLKEIV